MLNSCFYRKSFTSTNMGQKFWPKMTTLVLTPRVQSWIHGPSDPGTDRSDLVRDFLNFVGPDPVRFKIFQILLVLIRVGPGFLKIFWSWFGPVLFFSKFLVLVRSGSRLINFFWSWSGLVLGSDQTAWSSRLWSVDPWVITTISELLTKCFKKFNNFLSSENQRNKKEYHFDIKILI